MTTLPLPTRKREKTRPSRADQRRRITPEDLCRFHFIGDPQVSPNGRRVVFVKKHVGEKNQYVQNLWIVELPPASNPVVEVRRAPNASQRNGPTPDDKVGSVGPARQFTSGGKDSQPRWSPDSSRIAFISAREKDRPQIALIPADGGEAVNLTRFPEGTIGSFKWSPDGSTIAVAFREQDPDWTTEAKKQREEKGLSVPPRVLDDWWYRLDGDGYFNGQRFHLHLIDVKTGESRKVYDADTMGTFSFDFSPDSKQIVIATNRDPRAMVRPEKTELLRLDARSGKITPIPNLPEGPKARPAWSPDGKTIAYAGRIGADGAYSTENLELFVCDATKGKARSLTGGEDYCLMASAINDTSEVDFGPRLEWSGDSKRIYIQIGWHGEVHIASVSVANTAEHGLPARAKRSEDSRGLEAHAAVSLTIRFHTRGQLVHQMGNLSDDGPRMALTAGAALELDEVHVARIGNGDFETRAITDFNANLLRQLRLPKPRAHWIRGEDGTMIQVWSILPVGYVRGKKYPTILEIHGGPHAQYGVGFFHEFQVLAANGYAVFYCNPRGSKGYGRDFCAAIRGAWGTKDWEDIQTVIAFMKRQPWVNAKKMGVMGGSYGGYMTNWVIGHTDEFAAAITDRCVSNLVSMFGNSDYVDEPDRYWEGNAWDRPEARWNQSPLKHLGNVRTPTLIIHSEGDLRCNVEQSEEVFAVLKSNDVPTRFVRYPASTSHGMSRCGPPDLRVHRLEQILEWWRRWL